VNPNSFSYSYPGPKIMINKELPLSLIRGTQSQDIEINIEGGAFFNLTITAKELKGFSINPHPILINLGSTMTAFRISVSEDFLEGNYFIQWELRGEKIP
jgi:hypothetical protein